MFPSSRIRWGIVTEYVSGIFIGQMNSGHMSHKPQEHDAHRKESIKIFIFIPLFRVLIRRLISFFGVMYLALDVGDDI